jgi:hypothetical protein
VACKNSQEGGIAVPTQVMSNDKDIPLPKIREKRRIDALPARYPGRLERICGLTRRAFCRVLSGMIPTILTITKTFDSQLCDAQETGAAGEPESLAGEHRKVALTDSAKIQAIAVAGSGLLRPVRTEEFSIVGVFDVDWLLEPRFQRLLDNMAASPMAFRTVRFFGSLNSGTRENIGPTDSGLVWPSVASPRSGHEGRVRYPL